MSAMVRILATAVVLGLAGGTGAKALNFPDVAYLALFFTLMFLVGLTDRDRFYLRDLQPPRELRRSS